MATIETAAHILVTIAQPQGGYCGHRILLHGLQAGREMSATTTCATRDEALAIMLRNPPILTRQEVQS